jgi:hypothetical protein
MMLADELRSASFQVIEASHADEALNVLQALARVDMLLPISQCRWGQWTDSTSPPRSARLDRRLRS